MSRVRTISTVAVVWSCVVRHGHAPAWFFAVTAVAGCGSTPRPREPTADETQPSRAPVLSSERAVAPRPYVVRGCDRNRTDGELALDGGLAHSVDDEAVRLIGTQRRRGGEEAMVPTVGAGAWTGSTVQSGCPGIGGVRSP
jgi:hypothetical protein